MNYKPTSFSGDFKLIELFWVCVAAWASVGLKRLSGKDLEVFVEHEQDRGTMIASTRTRLKTVVDLDIRDKNNFTL